MSRQWSQKDGDQIVRAEHDDEHDAKRVVIVGGEAPKINVTIDTNKVHETIMRAMEKSINSKPKYDENVQVKQEIQTITVEKPYIVEKIEYREIEKPYIVEKIQYKEIEKHIITPQLIEYREIEKPVVIKETVIEIKEVPIIVEKFSKLAIGLFIIQSIMLIIAIIK